MVDAKVIVMEPSDSQARELEALLRFLDLDPVRFHDLAELGRKTEGAHDWLALIVGQETIASDGPELVERLRAMAQLSGTGVGAADPDRRRGHRLSIVDQRFVRLTANTCSSPLA